VTKESALPLGLLDAPHAYGSQASRFKEKPMARLVVLYKTPKSADAFDRYYFATHVPIAKKIPGLKKYDVSKGAVASPAGASGVHLVATLYFDSLDAIKAAFASAEGQATAGDLANFADGGADLYFFDTKEV
jgi:uncharacterized protein (TIGR02118 family)